MLVLGLGLAGLLTVSGETKQVIDKIVATVKLDSATKADVIMLADLEKNAAPLIEQYKQVTPELDQKKEDIPEIRKRTLDFMIDEKIILQEAKKRQIKISRQKVQQGLDDVKKRFPSTEEFNSELKKQGFTAVAFEKHIEEQLMAIGLIDIEVNSKVSTPKEDEVKQFFDKVMKYANVKKLPDTASEDDKELAGIAQLINRQFGERIRVRHVLIRFKKDAADDEKKEARKKIDDVKSLLAKGEDFADLAEKYSEDTGSKKTGGELPAFGRNELSSMTEFEKAAFALQVGEVSDIVETEFGYHLIKCEEKKAASKVNLSDIKDDLGVYLKRKKMETQYKAWLKILREKSFIKTYPID